MVFILTILNISIQSVVTLVTMIMLDIIHRPAFYLKQRFGDLGPIDSVGLRLRIPGITPIGYKMAM
jgi:hypothetical protein